MIWATTNEDEAAPLCNLRSLDLVDLHGVGRPNWYHHGPVKGRGSTSYHPIPLARPKSWHREQQRWKNTCLLLCARGGRLEPRPEQSPQHLPTAFLNVQKKEKTLFTIENHFFINWLSLYISCSAYRVVMNENYELKYNFEYNLWMNECNKP